MNIGKLLTKQKGSMFVNKESFNNMANSVNQLRKIDFNHKQFNVFKRPDGFHVSLRDFSTGADFEHMFLMEETAGASGRTDSITVRPGIWSRCDIPNASSHGYEYVYDPVALGIIPEPDSEGDGFSGFVHVYAVLKDSSGGTGISELFDITNDSTDYDGANGVDILLSVKPISSPYFQQFLWLGDIEYVDSSIVGLNQIWVGGYKDGDDALSYTQKFSFKNVYECEETSEGSSEEDTVTTCYKGKVYLHAGTWEVRNLTHNLAEEVYDIEATDDDLYIQAKLISTTTDPSLEPTSAEYTDNIAWQTEDDYTWKYKRIGIIDVESVDLDDAVSGDFKVVIPIVEKYHEGDLRTDWVRPDSEDTGDATIDDDLPRGKTIGFVPSGKHKGELEDYNFTTSVIGNFDYGDYVFPYFEIPEDEDATPIVKKYIAFEEIDVITDLRWDASTKQIQVKTRTILSANVGAESAWTEAIQAVSCDCGEG